LGDVLEGINVLQISNWNKIAKYRIAWKKTEEQAKAHEEL
jgi:hypothetical protein